MTSARLHRAPPACGVTRAPNAGTHQPSLTHHLAARTPPASESGLPVRRVANRGFTRGGSALCGVLGFEQHLGLWPALLGGVGWLIASDHAGYLLRRRYAERMRARLSRWHPKDRAHGRLIASLHVLVGDPRRVGAVSYPLFALINAASALVWGSAFVGAGYFLAARWHSGRTNWTSLALVLAATGVIFACVLSRIAGPAHRPARRRGRRPAPTAPPPQLLRPEAALGAAFLATRRSRRREFHRATGS